MSLEINIKTDQLHELEAYVGSLQGVDLSPISKAAADFVVDSGTDAFTDESLRPSPWAPLSKKYEQKLRRDWSKKTSQIKSRKLRESAVFEHQLLIDSEALHQSLSAKEGEKAADGSYVSRVASDREYAAYHQFGTSKMPARPFLPIDADLSIGTATLTEKAWNTVKPTLLSTLKRITNP